ncbi:HIT domain-containing protein [candidate division KSB1 bacterium]
MERLWSPWRSQYVESLQNKQQCEFCRILEKNDDESTFILLRKNHNFVVMNIYPYNSGHLLIVPYEHVDDITVLPIEVVYEAADLINLSIKALRNLWSPKGMNVGLNLGAAAGAGIHEHVHYHVVPRWTGDTNFMPVIGKTKIISQDLRIGYEHIKAEFHRMIKD